MAPKKDMPEKVRGDLAGPTATKKGERGWDPPVAGLKQPQLVVLEALDRCKENKTFAKTMLSLIEGNGQLVSSIELALKTSKEAKPKDAKPEVKA